MNSGTDAVLLALRALDIGPGDEVIVPAMTFIATAEPIELLGAKPVFADIDPVTYTISAKEVAKKITKRTRAVMVVHLYGQPADLTEILQVTQKHRVPLIEDMAQSLGAEYKKRRVGSFGQLACVSFFPTKNVGAYGDAGAVLTPNPALAERVRRLRSHGAAVKYYHEEVGYNSRLDEIQAAILRVKLKHAVSWNKARGELAERYNQLLAGLPVGLPRIAPDRSHVYHLYSIRVSHRDELRTFLEEKGVVTGLHYPLPLHLQPAFKQWKGKPGDFPESEGLAKETLSLPLYPHLKPQQQKLVADAIRAFFD